MTLLALLVLAQPSLNLNLAPVDVRQAGVRKSAKRAWAVDCTGAGVTCQSDGGVWTLNVTGGGGGSTPTVSCTAGQALSWDGVSWSCINKINEAQATDAGVTAQRFDHTPSPCGAGQYVSAVAADGTLTCSTPAGGGGSQNVATGTLAFGTGAYDAVATVTATWATTTSVIVCTVLGDEAAFEGITASVVTRSAGSFTVRGVPGFGRAVGNYTLHCTGL